MLSEPLSHLCAPMQLPKESTAAMMLPYGRATPSIVGLLLTVTEVLTQSAYTVALPELIDQIKGPSVSVVANRPVAAENRIINAPRHRFAA